MLARLGVLLPVAFSLLVFSRALAAPAIQITSPLDQSFANPSGGPPDLVEVTYQVTGNTCTGFRSTYAIVPYVNGVAVACAGNGCGCDGTTESCNNVTKTITLDGNAFNSCLNTIQLEMSPRPFCSPLCISPCSSAIFTNTIQVWQGEYKTCTGPGDCNKSTVGKPVDVATGKMYHEMTDLRIAGPLPIEFTRRYDSQSTFNGAMGFGWQHAYQMRIEAAGTNRQVFVDATGRRIYFAKNGQGAWDENRIEHLVLSAPGSPAWRVTDKHQTKYEFDGAGKLTRIADRNNNQITLGYTGSNLTSITDTFGRVVTLSPDGNNRVQTLSAGGRTVTYTYDATTGNLERVDWSDGSFVTYEYDDASDVHNLTAARDSFGNLIEGHTYLADKVQTTQSDGGNYAYSLSYDSATQTTVTNSRAIDTVYTYDGFHGRVTSSTGPGCASCGGGGISASLTYDRFLNVTQVTDPVGVITNMTYDPKGNMLTGVEAMGTPRQRTWTYTYHSTFNFPATISIPTVGTCANPNKVVTNTYDGAMGDRLTEQITGCAGNATFSRTTTYTYDAADRVSGIMAEVNGSPTPVASSFAYKPFGPRTGMTFGNGLVDSRNYASRYQLGDWTLGNSMLGNLLSYTHVFDDDLDLTSRTDNLNAANNRTFGYDEIHRLAAAAGPWGAGTGCTGAVTYTYDRNGNRLCKGEGPPATSYTYVGSTNRLDVSTGGEPATYAYL